MDLMLAAEHMVAAQQAAAAAAAAAYYTSAAAAGPVGGVPVVMTTAGACHPAGLTMLPMPIASMQPMSQHSNSSQQDYSKR